MNNTTKTILFAAVGLGALIGGYYIYKNYTKKTGSGVDDKKVTAEAKQNTIQLVRA